MVKYERQPRSTAQARNLRRNQTDAENKLWYLLRSRRLVAMKFRRQTPVGPYIVDFVCLRRKVIVEADGSQHIESERDSVRDQWLAKEGFTILRYSNRDILKNPDAMLADLVLRLDERLMGSRTASPSPGLGSLCSPRPPSPPEGRGNPRRLPRLQHPSGDEP